MDPTSGAPLPDSMWGTIGLVLTALFGGIAALFRKVNNVVTPEEVETMIQKDLEPIKAEQSTQNDRITRAEDRAVQIDSKLDKIIDRLMNLSMGVPVNNKQDTPNQ